MMPRLEAATTAAVLAQALTASAAGAQLSFTEDFTTTTYQDAASTTADWNTAAGELRLFPFALETVGSLDTGGNAIDVVVDGNLAFIADDPNIRVVDVSDPTSPTLLGGFSAGMPRSVHVRGDLLYVANGTSGLTIVNVANELLPTMLATLDTPGTAADVEVAGDVAYVADGASGLRVVDVSDPTAPFEIGAYDTPNSANGVDVVGDLCYVADRSTSGIIILDVSDPSAPTLVGGVVLPGDTWNIAVDGDLAYASDTGSGLSVLDVSDPSNPTVVGSLDPGPVRNLDVEGDRVYAAATSEVHVIDVSNPANPTLIASVPTPGLASSIAVAGTHAYVADAFAGGVQVLRVRHLVPTLVQIGSVATPGSPFRVAVSGEHAFVAALDGGLRVIDIFDPSDPVEIGSAPGGARAVELAGEHAFVASGDGSLRTFDITDPSSPVEIGAVTTAGLEALGLAVVGDHAFVADGSAGLRVFDITSPASPVEIGSAATPGQAQWVSIAGDLAFVAAFGQGLRVVDISDPSAPLEVGFLDTPGLARDVEIRGDHAFVADASSGLRVIDIGDPANPSEVGFFEAPGMSAVEVAVAGDHVFLGARDSGVLVIDISNPTSPVQAALYEVPGTVRGLALVGDRAFVADRDLGLRVVQAFQAEVDVSNDRGQSAPVVGAEDAIVRARLTTVQTNTIDWELSADGGASWQHIEPDGQWNSMTNAGTDLLWRSTHAWVAPGVNPTASELTLEWLGEAARIDAVSDVPDDQGRRVRVEWLGSGRDFAGDPQQVIEYALYRKIDPDLTRAPNAMTARQAVRGAVPVADERLMMGAAGWDYLLTIPASTEDQYTVIAPTLADSTADDGHYLTTFRVRALTDTPGLHFDSAPDSGYSVDNLAPDVPQSFMVAYETGSGNTLSWDEAPEVDFRYFNVYRSLDPDFDPAPSDLVHQTATPGWTDPEFDGAGVYYKVTALDHSGNESDPASDDTAVTVGGASVPGRPALAANVPNPFNPRTEIRYDVPASGADVRIVVFDAEGRHVRTLVDGPVDGGRHRVSWDGTTDRGVGVATGVYFYRMRAGAFTETRKMQLLK